METSASELRSTSQEPSTEDPVILDQFKEEIDFSETQGIVLTHRIDSLQINYPVVTKAATASNIMSDQCPNSTPTTANNIEVHIQENAHSSSITNHHDEDGAAPLSSVEMAVLNCPAPPLTNFPSTPTTTPMPTAPVLMNNSINQHETENNHINYISYESELQMPSIMKLIQKDLSEPYSIYTYRYFIHNWPKLCFLAIDTNQNDAIVGAIVCKLDVHKQNSRRGYIAMLAVDEGYRRKKIGSSLVLRSIRAMAIEDADEIVLETEITNKSALRLYENLGFVRDKRLFRYYLNGVDALRLKLWLK